jgi:hypothetical protein
MKIIKEFFLALLLIVASWTGLIGLLYVYDKIDPLRLLRLLEII